MNSLPLRLRDEACAAIGVSPQVLFDRSRTPSRTFARTGDFPAQRVEVWAMMRAYDRPGIGPISYPEIAKACLTSHSTVIDALQRAGKWRPYQRGRRPRERPWAL